MSVVRLVQESKEKFIITEKNGPCAHGPPLVTTKKQSIIFPQSIKDKVLELTEGSSGDVLTLFVILFRNIEGCKTQRYCQLSYKVRRAAGSKHSEKFE